MQSSYILLAIPFFFLLMGLEYLYGRWKQTNYYRLNDTITNLTIGIGNQVFNLLFKGLLFGLFVWVKQNLAITEIPATWWSFVLCVLLFDFLFYWAHRWGHEVNFFWGAHAVHHQSEEYNLSVALRQSWFHNAIAFFIFLPIPLLGFDPMIFGVAAVSHTLYQFWIHTKAVYKMHPWLEYWLNTPSHHRVHHAINPEYIDKNHGGVLIIWDRLFGTFAEEKADKEIYYGITTPLNSWNPAWANIQYYVDLFKKAGSMKWLDKLKLIAARPGWMPSYLGGPVSVQEVNPNTYTKYNTTTPGATLIYAVVQFAILLWGTVQYMQHFSTISLFYKVVFFLLLLITMLIIGALFENRKWVMYAEYARLILVGVSINTFYYYWFSSWFNVTLIVSSIVCILCIGLLTYTLKEYKRWAEDDAVGVQ